MTELIGRFLSFEEHLGRGLVKFAYYVALFYLVVLSLYDMVGFLFGGFRLGQFLLVPFKFLISILVLRVVAELVMAILSIDDHLQQGARATDDGFEAGLTPSTPAPSTTIHDAATPAPPTAPVEEASEETTGEAEEAARKAEKKAAKKAKKAKEDADDKGA